MLFMPFLVVFINNFKNSSMIRVLFYWFLSFFAINFTLAILSITDSAYLAMYQSSYFVHSLSGLIEYHIFWIIPSFWFVILFGSFVGTFLLIWLDLVVNYNIRAYIRKIKRV